MPSAPTLSSSTLSTVVRGLLNHAAKSAAQSSSKSSLLDADGEISDHLQVMFTLEKVPSERSMKPIRVKTAHSVLSGDLTSDVEA